jgi:hypothetical protein
MRINRRKRAQLFPARSRQTLSNQMPRRSKSRQLNQKFLGAPYWRQRKNRWPALLQRKRKPKETRKLQQQTFLLSQFLKWR